MHYVPARCCLAVGATRPVLRAASLVAKRHHADYAPALGDKHSRLIDIEGPVDLESFKSALSMSLRSTQPKAIVVRSQIQPDAELEASGSAAPPPVVLPALARWFSSSEHAADLSPHMKRHCDAFFPYELLLPSASESSPSAGDSAISRFLSWLSSSSNPTFRPLRPILEYYINLRLPSQAPSDVRFIRFEAPLALFIAGLEYNREQASPDRRLSQLYIAQASLSFLPHELRRDVPTPAIIRHGGKGDIYSSSVWLGLEPTYTPWHRDPNPNLFCQLFGSKAIRFLPGRGGGSLFKKVQARLGRHGANPRIMTEEMMQGAERQAFLDAVWGEGAPANMIEIVLQPRDVLYLPTGWWHSVKSMGENGGLNASVNWWFR